jgi:hypothetical protein
LRPIELERAKALATAQELRIPELLRQLLNAKWQEAAKPSVRDEVQADGSA